MSKTKPTQNLRHTAEYLEALLVLKDEEIARLKEALAQLIQEKEDDYLLGIVPPDSRLEDEDIPF